VGQEKLDYVTSTIPYFLNNIMESKLAEPKSSLVHIELGNYLFIHNVSYIMASTNEHLRIREQVRSNRPSFVRQESWRYKRVKPNWRKPRGKDSFMRLQKKGWPKLVKIGYGGPKAGRYLHPSGYYDILVHNVNGLSVLNPKNDAVRIAATVGKRKRKEIIEKAKGLRLKVLNAR